MSRTNQTIRLSAKTFLFSIGLTLVACGGGDDPTTYPSITYTGATGAAVVTEANAADFPVAMLEGSSSSGLTSATPLTAIMDGDDATQSAQHTAMLNIVAKQLKNNILNQQNNSGGNNLAAAATFTDSVTDPGSCSTNPGSRTLTATFDTTALTFSGNATYNNFCEAIFGYETTSHGKMTFSGIYTFVYDPEFMEEVFIFESMTLSIEYLKLTVNVGSEIYSEEFSGSMTMTYDQTVENDIASLTVVTSNFQANDLTYKIENMNMIEDPVSGALTISARFYHPTHGYVDVTTEPFDLVPGSNPKKYCSGIMEMSGTNGDPTTPVDTTIEFEANSNCTNYKICVRPSADLACFPDAAVAWTPWP